MGVFDDVSKVCSTLNEELATWLEKKPPKELGPVRVAKKKLSNEQIYTDVKISTDIEVPNKEAAEAILSLLKVAVSVDELIFQNQTTNKERTHSGAHSIQWSMEYNNKKAMFNLSLENESLTKENVQWLLDLSLKGKFDQIKGIVEELLPYDGGKGKVDHEKVDDEIGVNELENFIVSLLKSYGIDDKKFGYKQKEKEGRAVIVGFLDKELIEVLSEKEGLHVKKRELAKRGEALSKKVFGVDVPVTTSSNEGKLLIEVTPEQLQLLARLQSLQLSEKTGRWSDRFNKGSVGTLSDYLMGMTN